MPNKQPPIKNQFKPGQSGNPKGRPTEVPDLREIILKQLGREGIEKLVEKLEETAHSGDGAANIRAAEALFNRLYGMPTQQTDITTKGESLNHPKELIYQTAPTNGVHPDSVTPEASNGS